MRWTARLLALVAAGLFVAFIITSGASVFSTLSWASAQGLPLLIALVIAIAGVLIAWRWELVGGAMALGGAVAIIALVCAGSGGDMFTCALLFTLPLLAAGALYLACCWRKRAISTGQEA
jgi:hypothetical protein